MTLKLKCLTVVLLLYAFVPIALPAQERPNIILFIADDISYNDFGCYGHRVIKTPHIDRLASSGIRFTNAILTTSSCSPSRASIITGRYPHNTGAPELHTEMADNQIPFPRLLREKGYYTAQAGKWHLGSKEKGKAMAGAFDRTGGDAGHGGGPSGAAMWVDYIRTRDRQKPFFMWFAAHDAHRAWDKEEKPVVYHPSEVVVPPYLRDTEETRQDLASYYGEVSRFDFFIGKVVEELHAQKLADNTLIVVMADNGRPFPGNKTRLYDEGIKTPLILHWPAGIKGKGAVSNSLISSIDLAPTLLEVASVTIPESVQGKSFLSLFTNPLQPFRNYAFAEHNWHDFQAFERMVRTERFLYIENGLPQKDHRGAIDIMGGGAGTELQKAYEQGNLTDIQKRIFVTPQPQKEFYDCQEDPLQQRNLAGTRMFRREQRALEQALEEWRNQTGDTHPETITPDWYDRMTNKPLAEKGRRGVMPGTENSAPLINRKGPF